MERTEVLDMMGELKLYGMKSAYDETLAAALKRKHEPQQLVGDLLKAEISEKQARSIRYQLASAKLPLAKDVEDFAFKGTPINENLVRDLAGGTARRIWRSQSREAAFAPALAADSSPLSIWSTGSRPRGEPVGKDGSPIISPVWTSSSSMSSIPALRPGRWAAVVPHSQPAL